jgi:hypothetical protein
MAPSDRAVGEGDAHGAPRGCHNGHARGDHNGAQEERDRLGEEASGEAIGRGMPCLGARQEDSDPAVFIGFRLHVRSRHKTDFPGHAIPRTSYPESARNRS